MPCRQLRILPGAPSASHVKACFRSILDRRAKNVPNGHSKPRDAWQTLKVEPPVMSRACVDDPPQVCAPGDPEGKPAAFCSGG